MFPFPQYFIVRNLKLTEKWGKNEHKHLHLFHLDSPLVGVLPRLLYLCVCVCACVRGGAALWGEPLERKF